MKMEMSLRRYMFEERDNVIILIISPIIPDLPWEIPAAGLGFTYCRISIRGMFV